MTSQTAQSRVCYQGNEPTLCEGEGSVCGLFKGATEEYAWCGCPHEILHYKLTVL
jgi:hypothetical protein